MQKISHVKFCIRTIKNFDTNKNFNATLMYSQYLKKNFLKRKFRLGSNSDFFFFFFF